MATNAFPVVAVLFHAAQTLPTVQIDSLNVYKKINLERKRSSAQSGTFFTPSKVSASRAPGTHQCTVSKEKNKFCRYTKRENTDRGGAAFATTPFGSWCGRTSSTDSSRGKDHRDGAGNEEGCVESNSWGGRPLGTSGRAGAEGEGAAITDVDACAGSGAAAAARPAGSLASAGSLQDQANLVGRHVGAPPVVEVVLQVAVPDAELELLQELLVVHEV